MTQERIRLYDCGTRTYKRTSARKLAPGMVQAIIVDEETGAGTQAWIDARKPRRGEYQHPPFPKSVRNGVLRKIQRMFKDVRPLSLDEWEDSFRRDVHAN